jgi:hypothetical protein
MKTKILITSYLTTISANRIARNTEQTIESIADVFTYLIDTEVFDNHGCYCSALSQGDSGTGHAHDPADKHCKEWGAARKCQSLKDGACHGQNFPVSYTWTNTTGDPCQNGDTCLDTLCAIDQYYVSLLEDDVELVNQMNSTTPECVSNPTNVEYDACCAVSNGYARYVSTENHCKDQELLTGPLCEVVLVRQAVNGFHPSTDNLAGTAEYGTLGSNGNFSVKFDTWDFDTFIFATKDHTHFQAITKEALGGSLVDPPEYYGGSQGQARNIHSIQPGYTEWVGSTSKMYFRTKFVEDPWISMTNHWPIENNKMIYGEATVGQERRGYHRSLLYAHEGLQVYVLKTGSYDDCIVDGWVGKFENGLYVLNEVPYE